MKTLILFLLLFCGVTAEASVPRVFTIQGNLRDQSGNAVTGTHVMKVRFYDALTGGNFVFGEILSVTFANGLYNVTIGQDTPLPDSITFDKQYFLGIIIDNATELSPRTPLTLAPNAFYSLVAAVADSLNPKASANPSGIAGGDLAGIYPKPVVASIQSHPVSALTPQIGQTLIFDGTQWVPSSANVPVAFNVLGGTFQSLTLSTNNKIDFNADNNSGAFNDGGYFSLANDEFTAPSDGYYYFDAIVTVDSRSAGVTQNYMYFAVNGNTSAYYRFYDLYAGYPRMQLSMPMKLKAGDKVSVLVSPDKTVSTMGGNSYGVVRFSGFKIN